jgi:hypothetical protein
MCENWPNLAILRTGNHVMRQDLQLSDQNSYFLLEMYCETCNLRLKGEKRDLRPNCETRDIRPNGEKRDLRPNCETRDLRPYGEKHDLRPICETRDLPHNGEKRNLRPNCETRDLRSSGEKRDLRCGDPPSLIYFFIIPKKTPKMPRMQPKC